MNKTLQITYLARHGETAWTIRMWNHTHHVLASNGQNVAQIYASETILQPTR